MGQQIAFIIITVLCGMILSQIFITISEAQKMYNILEKKISVIEDMVNKNYY